MIEEVDGKSNNNKPDRVRNVPIMMVPSTSDFAAAFLAKELYKGIAQLIAIVFVLGYHEAQISRARAFHRYNCLFKFFFNRIGNFVQALVVIIKEGYVVAII